MISNSTKVWIFTLLTTMILLISGFVLWERVGLFVCFLISVTLHYFIFKGYQSPLMDLFKPTKIAGLDPWNLQYLYSQIQQKNHSDSIEICITDVPLLNSFIIKTPWKKGRIVFSRELLKQITDEEKEYLLAYHTNFLTGLNSFPNELLLILFSTLKSLTQFIDNIFRIHFCSQSAESLIIILQKIFFSRTFVMKCDQHVSDKNPHVIDYAMMIWKIAGWNTIKTLEIPASQNIYFFMDPAIYKNNSISSTHPPLSQRLKKITGYFPI